MFDLLKVKSKSAGRTLSPLAPSPPIEVPTKAAEKRPTPGGEKHPGWGWGEPSRKRKKVIVLKLSKKATLGEASGRAHRSKGKEPAKEVAESPDCSSTVRELCKAKYPNLSVEEDPFTDQLEDANVRMETSQPFNDNTPPKD
ncbi:hypothetical protein B296_00028737 [Ensete ventricosum]|uniref:Uncharacterized protein n=1 Tax=Ensete ventricosum TaxID=4639 RepID=A0A426ZRS0_ENSVE|nr:hypothetical protein B296_00028737 [Ensete ventricosum]